MKTYSCLITVLFASFLVLAVGNARAAMIVDFSADIGVHQTGGIVTRWDDQSGSTPPNNATTASAVGPVLTTTVINGRSHPVLRFDGTNFLTAAPHVPATGTLFIVFSNAHTEPADRRVIGWDDSLSGVHGVSIIPAYIVRGNLIVAARNNSAVGDIESVPPVSNMEVVTVSWGGEGVTLERRLATGAVLTSPNNTNITSVSDGGLTLHIGAPGDTVALPLIGDIAALRVYDQQLPPAERSIIADSLHSYWLGAGFAGTPGRADCHGKSVSALPPTVIKGGLRQAAVALGFDSVAQLQQAITAYCGN
jgi:hypothetical protein